MTTIAEYLTAADVQIAPSTAGTAGVPEVSIDLPEQWQAVDLSVFPGAYGVWALPPAGGWADNVVLLVGKLSAQVDPEKLLECSFTDADQLPGWQEISRELGEYQGLPSAAVTGTYKLDALDLWVHTRYIVAVAGEDEYLIQLTVTARAEQVGEVEGLIGGLVLH
ncbi:LpqN/LpqT family lipoprotein [Nocardia jejuensis]|uniref:LpqN/LpqT family lipoprotein n=1 Tax=Nocardia jejuensis TaxID=328049 RepID=UPI000B11CA88|nr:LpqN/LpqT family lipoprotein [Nocardia jejuensis]